MYISSNYVCIPYIKLYCIPSILIMIVGSNANVIVETIKKCITARVVSSGQYARVKLKVLHIVGQCDKNNQSHYFFKGNLLTLSSRICECWILFMYFILSVI